MMLSHTRGRSIRRINEKMSRWPAQAIATTTKLMRKAVSDGRISSRASRSD